MFEAFYELMLRYVIIIVFLLENSSCDSRYECGAHGKFEYCIDDIPGCIIGCHCHPGYYFDTDTKVCEPNTKLTHDFRRQYYQQPTRVPEPEPLKIPERKIEEDLDEFISTTSQPDEKENEVVKDVEDLSDWLYNQFFKTIENQVINNTDQQEDTQQLTRRSGRSHAIKSKSKRKASRRKSSKKKKKKNHKKKLLRIPADDSMFDSSESESDDDSDSSSESSDSDISVEGAGGLREHGHKKMILLNKRSKSDLPSFIFLPNSETPFYPPIGLPPPPPMPMYPLIPVPPMMPSYPLPVMPCEDTTTAKTTTTESTKETTTETSSKTTTESTKETTLITTTQSGAEGATTSSVAAEDVTTESKETRLRNRFLSKIKKAQRKKMMQKLQEQNNMNMPLMQNFGQPQIPMQNNNIDIANYDLMSNPFTPNTMQSIPVEEKPSPENVDFKYLTQLIHKIKPDSVLNNTPNVEQCIPPKEVNPVMAQNALPPIEVLPLTSKNTIPIATRRLMQERRDFNNQDESYYANLGRQIASLIRNVSPKDREINIEIENHVPRIQIQQPMINDNSIGTRSYWERFVRSPMSYYPRSELSGDYLMAIENQVNTLATTPRSYSLNELENIIKMLGQPKQIEIKLKRKKAKDRLNFSLLPTEEKTKLPKNTLLYPYNNKKAEYTNVNTSVPINSDAVALNMSGTKSFRRFASKMRDLETALTPNIEPIPRDDFRMMFKMPQKLNEKYLDLHTSHAHLLAPLNNKYQLNPTMMNFKNFKSVNANTNNLLNVFSKDIIFPGYYEKNQPLSSSYFEREPFDD